jgi:uncharacterized protein (DUF433 family)
MRFASFGVFVAKLATYSQAPFSYNGFKETRIALDWTKCAAVESVPGKVSGGWVFRGTRLPVTIVANLEDGMSIEEIMEQFDVTREQATAVLDFAAQRLEAPIRR